MIKKNYQSTLAGTSRTRHHPQAVARHFVQFYENDIYLTDTVARFIGAGLSVGEHVLIVCTKEHLRSIKATLQTGIIDLDHALSSGQLITLDAHETLSQLVINGKSNRDIFFSQVRDLIAGLTSNGKKLRVFGEMVALLAQQGRLDIAIEFEEWWNQLAREYTFSLFCAYSTQSFSNPEQRDELAHICSLHTDVTTAEDYSALINPDEKMQAISILQERSRLLDQEVSRIREADRVRGLLAAIVDSSEDAIISKSLDSIITSWNAGAQRLFGYTAEEVIGKPISILFPPDRLQEEDHIISRLRSGKRVEHFETVRVSKTGKLLDVSLTISPVRDSTGKLIGASKIARDITASKLAQKTLEKQNQRLRLLNDAASHLLAAEDPAEMIHGLFYCVREHLGIDCYASFTMDESDNTLTPLSSEGIPADMQNKLIQLEKTASAEGAGSLRKYFTTTQSANSLTEIWSEILEPIGIHACVCQPLLAGHHLLGILIFASTSRTAFENDELEFIRTLCHYASGAIERVRLLTGLRDEDRKKNEFLATLAHELRNPLAPLRSSLDLIRIGYQDPATRQQLHEIMSRQLNQLTRLVDDLLEISRITSGKVLLRREPTDISIIIRQAIDAAAPMIEKAGHKLIVSLPPQPVMIDADPVRLAQVFINLLNNAAKYTEENGTITVDAKQVSDKSVRISIHDTGMGIPADMLSRVFDMFAQVDRNLKRSQGGLGIGLAIARKMVELHGGQIEAHSDGPGKGSEFIVHLSCMESANRESDIANLDGQNITAARRIMIVDDNRDAATALNMLLRSFGHMTRVAYDGSQAVLMAEEFKPDVVLMDLGMPHMDGFQAARKLRQTPWGARTLLVALSGWGQEEDRRKATEAGFDHHYTKPVDIDVILNLITKPHH